jgi:hydroxyethylthiazole kinase
MLWQDILKIRSEAPLIHNITNYVVMNVTANALLSLGASPVMAHAQEEVEEMTSHAKALVLNLGTLSAPWIDAMLKAGQAAVNAGIPIVLDPVGSGATQFRTQTAKMLIQKVSPSIIRGNSSEIRSLILDEQCTKGVDSIHAPEQTIEEARLLSGQHGCVVSISGATDVIIERETTIRVFNGHSIMPRITGMGCIATSLTAAFAAVNPSRLHAAANAMALMGIAGEMAAEKSNGPASFEIAFLDALYTIRESDIQSRLRMEGIQWFPF